MAKITEYTEATRFDTNDILIKDGTGGTKKITADNAAREFSGLISAANHRCVWGGRNLGTSVTTAQKTAISSGTFDDLYIGDYWVINGVTWRIWDMDYFLQCGDTALTKHHLVIVPDASLYSHVMNDTNITTGGYVGSKMYTEGLETAKTKFTDSFGDMIITHRDYLTNAVSSSGYPSGGAWFDSTVELMNEIMVYGCHIYSPMPNGSTIPTKYTTGKQQFAAAMLNPTIVNKRYTYWLRDVVSAAAFAAVYGTGFANYYNASLSGGVRPYALIG